MQDLHCIIWHHNAGLSHTETTIIMQRKFQISNAEKL